MARDRQRRTKVAIAQLHSFCVWAFVTNDPHHAATWFFGQSDVAVLLGSFSIDFGSFQLDVSHDAIAFKNDVVAGSVNLRLQDFDSNAVAVPTLLQDLRNKYVLDKLFVKRRMD